MFVAIFTPTWCGILPYPATCLKALIPRWGRIGVGLGPPNGQWSKPTSFGLPIYYKEFPASHSIRTPIHPYPSNQIEWNANRFWKLNIVFVQKMRLHDSPNCHLLALDFFQSRLQSYVNFGWVFKCFNITFLLLTKSYGNKNPAAELWCLDSLQSLWGCSFVKVFHGVVSGDFSEIDVLRIGSGFLWGWNATHLAALWEGGWKQNDGNWVGKSSIYSFVNEGDPTWMSQEVSKWFVNGLQPQYTPFISRL